MGDYLAIMTIGLLRQRRVATWLSIALLAAVVVVLLVYRGRYGMWPWNTYPSTLHACGRDFAPVGDPISRAAVVRNGRIVRHGSLPTLSGGETVWTSARGGRCGEMWVQGSSNRYRPYTLLGGP